ncbi:uncharacterized protein LOC143906185 isoform X3 [Temnothorax americanus]|uniref:uncharacterized protein LOC143906185 isoform X3 n=1 Tax=Temnothorax americanus TaxID=1964332 RepID=UPI0040679523
MKNTLLFSDVIFNLTTLGGKQKKDINLVYSLTDEMIQQRIRKLNNPDTLEDENNQIHRTFFDILMETSRKENFTSERICDYVTTMLLTLCTHRPVTQSVLR